MSAVEAKQRMLLGKAVARTVCCLKRCAWLKDAAHGWQRALPLLKEGTVPHDNAQSAPSGRCC